MIIGAIASAHAHIINTIEYDQFNRERELSNLRYISMDEFFKGKGMKYDFENPYRSPINLLLSHTLVKVIKLVEWFKRG